jgi:hypothetical protein
MSMIFLVQIYKFLNSLAFISDQTIFMKPGKIQFYLTLPGIFLIGMLFSSCTHNADISNLPEICFDRDILPIYANNCALSGCHTSGAGGHEHFALDNYTEIRRTVVPFKPSQSESYKAIISAGGEGHMPPNQVLSKEQRTIILVWIDQGANQTTCTAQ